MATAFSAIRSRRERVEDKTYKNGVIGRTLTDDERYDLIEYLKTL